MLPTSTLVSVDVQTKLPRDSQAVVVFAAQGGKISGDTTLVLGSAEFENAQRMIRLGVVKGKVREVDFDLLESPRGTVRRIYVAGLGDAKKITPDTFRQAAGAVVRKLRAHNVERAAVVPPVLGSERDALGTQVMVEGLLLAGFDYREYRDTKRRDAKQTDRNNDKRPKPIAVTLLSSQGARKTIESAAQRARLLCESQNFARTIAFRPGNDINPPRLAQVAQQMAREVGLKCRVLDEKEMKRLGMGGITAVGAGSAETPPRMIVLEHRVSGLGSRGSKSKKSSRDAKPDTRSPLLLVGKAVTFDTGGISIKPAANMQRMVYDKCGAMAVLGAMCAIARLKLPIPVVGILAAAENHISATAYRPGDILRMYNGVTVEVTNTDAEGRLVLADALAWGIETYRPAAVIDLATLTGAMVIALGHNHCGIMANNDKLVNELQIAADTAGEKIWRLPLGDEHRELMKSDVADILNSGSRDAGAIKGGAFLSFFVPPDNRVPWVHMDVAGVADSEKELPYYGKGATGWGVRTLVHLAESRAPGGR